MESSSEDYLLVAAIDFGTTYSGFAFSFRHEFQRDPTKVSARTWTATTGGLQSLKTSTCILFKPDGTFHSFGFKAEDKYYDLAEDDEHHGWHYFRRFKMQLYNANHLQKDFMLESESKTKLPAMKVFSESIRFLKDELLLECKKQNADIDDSDIKWVLTVPAIWTDPAKTFMRAAAEEAGISCDRLVIALEPEVAAIFVKHLPVQLKKEGTLGDSFLSFGPGQKYLVLDAGGGTIDIAVHEVKADGTVREITTANGGSWGGTQVDESFRKFLFQIFGDDVMNEFSKTSKADFLEMFRDFEVKKRSINKDLDGKITIKIPAKLNETFAIFNKGNSIQEKIKSHKFSSKITYSSDKIRIAPVVALSFFEESLRANISHLKELLKHEDVRHVESILMVGGYSECSLLVGRVREIAGGKRLIVPNEAGLVVLKGAVLFGHDPSLISERKSKYTYGIDIYVVFDPEIHSEEKRFTNSDGTVRCKDVFSKHVEVNESIIVGQTQTKRRYILRSDEGVDINIYTSPDAQPKYVTDTGCNQVGSIEICSTQERKLSKGDNIDVRFSFSGTEIEVSVVLEKNQEEFKTHIDFSH